MTLGKMISIKNVKQYIFYLILVRIDFLINVIIKLHSPRTYQLLDLLKLSKGFRKAEAKIYNYHKNITKTLSRSVHNTHTRVQSLNSRLSFVKKSLCKKKKSLCDNKILNISNLPGFHPQSFSMRELAFILDFFLVLECLSKYIFFLSIYLGQ